MFKGYKYITCLTFINEHSQGAIIIKTYYIKTSNYLISPVASHRLIPFPSASL